MSSEHSWVDLSHPFVTGMPGGPPHGNSEIAVALQELHGHPFAITRVAMSVHTGTHVDAPRHFLSHGKTIDEYPCQVFTGPGVVLDVSREGAVSVTATELVSATPKICRGDIVFLYFGYGKRFGTVEYQMAHPYLADDAAQMLADLNVPLLGVDLPTPDLPRCSRGESFEFPAHRILLTGDCLIIENLGGRLVELVGRRVDVLAAPLLIQSADGAPARVLARPETSTDD